MYESQSQNSLVKAKSSNFVFGTSKRELAVGIATDGPGPGNYDSGNKNKGVGYKFGTKI
jgi:hypothetical protein